MAVTTTYYDEFGNLYELVRDSDGFWVSAPSPDPVHFETAFTATGTLDTALTIQMRGVESDWFQIDNVKLYGNDDIDDNYNIVVKVFNDAELLGNPQLYSEISEFPNQLTELLIPVNEVITHTSFNTILGKMEENFKFLIDKSKFLSVPPNDISFRYGPSTYGDYDGRNVWTQADNGYSSYWGYSPTLDIDHVAGISNAMIYASDNVLYAVNTLSGADPLPIDVTIPPSRDFYIYGDDKFVDIKSIEIDSNEFIWILDDTGNHGKVGIFSFDGNWRLQSSWDITTEGSKKYLINPTDLKIKDGLVYIACGNVNEIEIRVFSEVGSYLGSINLPELTTIDSIAITTDHIIALRKNILYVFNMELEFVNTIDMTDQITTYNYNPPRYDEAAITRLCNDTTGLFFYGIAGNQIYKFGKSGNILESFGYLVVNFINSTIGDIINNKYFNKPLKDLYQDADYNLYSASKYDVVRYFDRANIFNRLLSDLSFDIGDSVWDEPSLNVSRNENTTAWVYNRVFDRILDNLNIFRLALKGSQAIITSNSFKRVAVDSFSPAEYKSLDYDKGEITIGVNELHCEGSLNRCITQLNECFNTCLGLLNIKGSGIDPESLRILSFELTGQDNSTPFANLIDGVYYVDYGRTVSNIALKWTDTITYRSDPKLRAYITRPSLAETALGRFPTLMEYTDTRSFVNTPSTWTLRETYGILERTRDVNMRWSSRIYAGILPDSIVTIDGADIIENATWNSLAPILDGAIPPIDVSSGDRWFIAVPADEWDSGDIRIIDGDYPDMEYDFSGVNQYVMQFPDFGYGNIDIDYYVFTPESPIYSTGITEINFSLVRT